MARRRKQPEVVGPKIGAMMGLLLGAWMGQHSVDVLGGGSIGQLSSRFLGWVVGGLISGGLLGTIAEYVILATRRAPKKWAAVAQMSGSDFERWIARQYRRQGWHVQHTGQSGDHGRDLVLTHLKERWTVIVQCKRWDQAVGEPVLRDLLGTVTYYKARKGVLVTTMGFTEPALRWSRHHEQIELIGPKILQQWLRDDLQSPTGARGQTSLGPRA